MPHGIEIKQQELAEISKLQRQFDLAGGQPLIFQRDFGWPILASLFLARVGLLTLCCRVLPANWRQTGNSSNSDNLQLLRARRVFSNNMVNCETEI
jgi:hypothetical protein